MSNKNYHPPSHTTEHILNRTMVNMFGTVRSVSTHLEKKKSKCDYPLPEALTKEQVTAVEQQVNSILQQDVPVTEKFVNADEIPPEIDVSKLPPGALDAPVRLICIGDYDVCPCIGAHVSRTSEIKGVFRIISSTYENGIERIRWTVK